MNLFQQTPNAVVCKTNFLQSKYKYLQTDESHILNAF